MTAVGAVDATVVAHRLDELRARIARASGGRAVEIVAVTKGFDASAVDAAVAAGLTSIGENYAQELLAKVAAIAGGPVPRWHFIGALQRNKVAALSPHVALWQTVDRAALADAIARHAPGAEVLVQVNLTGDRRRAGCEWSDAADLVAETRRSGLDVRGLMGVGPDGPPELSRPAFAALADLAGRLELAELSMGMTSDLDVAVAEGATMVRVGTALFGPRPSAHDLRR
ncbi:MAG: YggS family pyridoxal phosphate-dependent enzyme [Acidimicrobiales bacterium]